MKRVSRKKLMVFAFLIITIAYLGALYQSIQLHNAWRQTELEKYPPDVRTWIDLPWFSHTTTGLYFMFSGFALAWCWALLFAVTVHHRLKHRRAAVCLFFSALFMGSVFIPLVAAGGYYEKTIDVLVVEDEEFRGLSSLQRYWWYQTLNNVAFSNFKTYYGVEFKIRGYVEWDSNDASNNLYYLLEEAISETGYSFRMLYNGYYIDLLMVFTGQEDPYLMGLSPPEWYALILEYWIDPAKAMVHELGHQFLLLHCNNDYCAMNPDSLVAGYFCVPCGNQVEDNYPRFWRWISSGGGCPTLFVWDGSQYVEEALLDIHADSDVTLQHTIGQILVPEKNSYKLSLRELDEFTSHIDQVKLYAVDSDDGEMHETHLTKAVHSELGDVKEPLLHDDDTRLDLTPQQTIDLEFTLPNIDDVAYFTFEINGYNIKFP